MGSSYGYADVLEDGLDEVTELVSSVPSYKDYNCGKLDDSLVGVSLG